VKLEDSDRAVRIARTLKQLQEEKDSRSYRIGQLGYYAKEMGDDFLRANNADSWASFLAENNMAPSTINKYIHLYRIFGEDGIDIAEEQWKDIGPRKLAIISPHVAAKSNRDYNGNLLVWAETLSTSDLIKEIKGDSGHKSDDGATSDFIVTGRTRDNAREDHAVAPLSTAQYIKKVKSSPCCVCGQYEQVQIHSHHFPQTRNRTDRDWKVIPVCGECHQEAHQNPKEWLWTYRPQIMGWFYSMIVEE